MMTRRLKSLYDEWGTLDRMYGAAKDRKVKKAISARKKRVGELIIRIEKRRLR